MMRPVLTTNAPPVGESRSGIEGPLSYSCFPCLGGMPCLINLVLGFPKNCTTIPLRLMGRIGETKHRVSPRRLGGASIASDC